MKEQLITFETAKLAKEKGFISDWKLGQVSYNEEGELTGDDTNDISAPTQSELQKWLREEHNIEVQIYRVSEFKDASKYGCEIEQWNKEDTIDVGNYYDETYEKVFEKGLYKALEHLK